MRYARLLEPYKGYWDIQVDEDSITGGYHGYEYNCVVIGSIMAMSITVLSSGAERRLPATGMSLSLLTEYKGNGQFRSTSGRLPEQEPTAHKSSCYGKEQP